MLLNLPVGTEEFSMSAIVAQGIRANQQLADENGEGQNRTGDTTIFSRHRRSRRIPGDSVIPSY
jgi:hypothetical protein